MEKYQIYFADNGKIIFVPYEFIDEAIEADKELLVIQTGYRGNFRHAIGADKTDEGYMMYGYTPDETVLDEDALKRFHRVIFTRGEMVYMTDGDYADNHFGETWQSDRTNCQTIDYERTFRMLPSDAHREALKHTYPFFKYFKHEYYKEA